MKDYFFNFLLTAILSCIIAILSFLIGNEFGAPSIPTASVAGALGGVAIAGSYNISRLMDGTPWDKEMATRLVIMIVTGIVFGIFGGWIMSL